MNGSSICYKVTLGELAEVPGTPFAYWAPKCLRDLFLKFPPLDRDLAQRHEQAKIGDLKAGLTAGDNLRFNRFWWETSIDEITTCIDENGKSWVPLVRGGFPFFKDINLVVKWKNNGEEIRDYSKSVIRNEAWYFKNGVGWARVAESRIEAFQLPKGCIFDVNTGAGFFDERFIYRVISILNSELAWKLCNCLEPTAHTIQVGTLAKLPIFQISSFDKLVIDRLSCEAHDLYLEWAVGIETTTVFITPTIIRVFHHLLDKVDEYSYFPTTGHPIAQEFKWSDWESTRSIRNWLPEDPSNIAFSLRHLADICVERERMLRQRLAELQAQIDEEVYRLYEISPEDRALIEAELSQAAQDSEAEEEEASEEERVEEEVEPEVEGLMPAEEHLRRLVHYLAHEALKADEDGIIPTRDIYLSDGRLEPGLAGRVKQRLADTFGAENLDTCLRDLQDALGMPLEDWLEREFFNYHVSLYRLRPIIWQVASQRRGAAAFSCFVYWHKLDADSLRKIQQVYLRPLIVAAQQEADRLGNQLIAQRNAKAPLRQLREAERLSRQAEGRLSELKALHERIQGLLQPHALQVTSRSEWVKEKVNEIVRYGYRPERDYGVRVNIEPLKQAGILPQAAERVKG